MSEKTSTRLSKAAAEFNVSIQTIVEVLAKKGHKIDGGPNTKIPSELFDILVKEFASDMKAKRVASKIELEYNKREPIVQPKKEVRPEEEPEAELKELMIKNTQIGPAEVEKGKKQTQPQPENQPEKLNDTHLAVDTPTSTETTIPVQTEGQVEKEIKHTEPAVVTTQEVVVKEQNQPEPAPEVMPEIKAPELTGPVILGKIELTDYSTGHHRGPKHPKEPKHQMKQAPAKPIHTETELPVSDQIEQKAKEQPVVEQAFTPQPESKPVHEIPEPVPTTVDVVTETTSQPALEPKVSPQVQEQDNQKEEKPKEDLQREIAAPTDQKTEAEVKVDEQTTVESKAIAEQKTVETVKAETEKPEEKLPDNFIKTTFKKLEGPTILGTIQLPETKKPTLEKRKPVASSSDDRVSKSKKKKRKRIKQGEEGTADQPQKQGTAGGGQQRQPQGGQNRQGQPGTGQPKPGQPAGTQTPGKPSENREKFKPKLLKDKVPNEKKGRRDAPKVELTEEEIEKQIKETLARLTTGGKSKASKHRKHKRDAASEKLAEEHNKMEADKMVLKVTEFVTANELATMMDIHVNEVISTCMSLGLFVSINQRLDAETINVVADEFGYKTEFVSADVQEAMNELESEDDPASLEPRHPIVTVMGHVDHGKTKLLDYIRNTNVVAGEAGGITQHIGAYEVQVNKEKKITFLDTPGHEAFTAMRARGAKVTDIAIIVIAADDNVMPQTKEAINHAQAAGVPMIFAINKIDKPNAQPEKVKEELAQMNILVEDWGGKYQSQEISAKNGINIDLLLEKVLLEAELLDLQANPNKPAVGTIIESSLDKGRGYLATVLVQSGTLKIGDLVLAGTTLGKVKAMYNERNQALKKAGPSTPVLLLGLNGAPQAGDKFNVMLDEREAKNISSKRLQLQREQGLRTQKHITLDEIGRRIAIGDFKELNLIVKGDVDGSVEALADSLLKLSNEEVQVNVIHKSVGQVTETDVMLASASNAVIIGFQVRPSSSARKLAEQEQIDIRIYSIIYTAIEEIKDAIVGMLAPKIEEKILCNLEIREVFKISKVGNIAGCFVLDGTIYRNTKVRIIRDGIVVYTGNLGSLKRFKDDVKEAKIGQECGLNIENFNDIKVGDIVEGFEQVEVKRTISPK
ncbi:MAG: translation initiation factor IF-2 [Bacteroidales bacterium]|nr:translation initiation factor IF-2 [Bacteroidales bacterium]MDD3663897.1 translation initiation factor IF-2 [Bacteroidales bacterium]